MRYISIFLFVVFFLHSISIEQRLEANNKLRDINKIESSIVVDLKYSTKDNFLHRDAYGSLDRCFLLRDTAIKLKKAQQYLKAYHKKFSLVVYDCIRPVSIQKKMWEIVKNSDDRKYVVNPYTKIGSIHNYGCAVDLSILDAKGKTLDMGGGFDYFHKISQPKYEFMFFKNKKLTSWQWSNRMLLRSIMLKAGFVPIPNEWWHFNCIDAKKVRDFYKKVD
jgi:D-alanyl-D-alanine dipeptidase